MFTCYFTLSVNMEKKIAFKADGIDQDQMVHNVQSDLESIPYVSIDQDQTVHNVQSDLGSIPSVSIDQDQTVHNVESDLVSILSVSSDKPLSMINICLGLGGQYFQTWIQLKFTVLVMKDFKTLYPTITTLRIEKLLIDCMLLNATFNSIPVHLSMLS